MSETLTDLQNFVTTQAAENAALPSDEWKYQDELVEDVLSQDAPNAKALKDLVDLYRTERQAA
jgi:hypothetical protein